MPPTYKQLAVLNLARVLHSYGYKVYLAKGRTHGFYTDGVRVVSFQYSLGGLDFSGNYRTNWPTQTGTGWKMEIGVQIPSREAAKQMVEAFAPRWAVGDAEVRYSTPEYYLHQYVSSAFTEFTEDQWPNTDN